MFHEIQDEALRKKDEQIADLTRRVLGLRVRKDARIKELEKKYKIEHKIAFKYMDIVLKICELIDKHRGRSIRQLNLTTIDNVVNEVEQIVKEGKGGAT